MPVGWQIMRVYLEKRVVLGLIAALTVLTALVMVSFLNNKKFAAASDSVAHTHAVLYHAEKLLATVVDAETGQRGFTLTGNEIFLEPYNRAVPLIDSHFNSLKSLTRPNDERQHVFTALKSMIDSKVNWTKKVVALRKQNADVALREIETLRGKLMMDSIRRALAAIETEEQQLLAQRKAGSDRQIANFNLTFTALVICIILILAFIFSLINKHLRAQITAEASLKQAANSIQDLYDNAPCGYHSLDADGRIVSVNNTLVNWLQYTKQELSDTVHLTQLLSQKSITLFREIFPKFKVEGKLNNLELEFVRKDGSIFPVILNSLAIFSPDGEYLRSRSTVFDISERKLVENQLIAINRELEGFTYSVSHDLRAPLRSINGYAKIIEQEYGSRVDNEGRRLLSIIIKNARQMGDLIDDLLEFSRLGRKELIKTEIPMAEIVKPIIAEIIGPLTAAGRKVNVDVHVTESARVDVSMMRQVWRNFIANALKFTSSQETTNIEIGSYPSGSENIFYIKDNGVGFDMKYVGKLFGVFQRLHKWQDFEGTGVGLAIIKRIIERHGGRVWAESQPNAGASFYLALPNT